MKNRPFANPPFGFDLTIPQVRTGNEKGKHMCCINLFGVHLCSLPIPMQNEDAGKFLDSVLNSICSLGLACITPHKGHH